MTPLFREPADARGNKPCRSSKSHHIVEFLDVASYDLVGIYVDHATHVQREQHVEEQDLVAGGSLGLRRIIVLLKKPT